MQPAASNVSEPSDGDDLRAALGRAHDEAAQLLAGDDVASMDVVSWLSAHIAAYEHVVYPVIRQAVNNGRALVDDDRAVVLKLARTLRIKERHHSGDTWGAGLSSARLDTKLAELVEQHQKLQAVAMDKLEAALGDAELNRLRIAYTSALQHAPTRPHPHLNSGGMLFRLDALRDRILDTMDGRHAPVPKPPKRRIIPGRWGSWLLGQQNDGSELPE
jgi:hypothetical protein